MPTIHHSTLTLVDRFIDAKIGEGRSVRTIQAYRQRCDRFTRWLGDRPISRATLRGYLAGLQHEHFSPFTVAAYFRDVKVFVRWLLDEQLLHEPDGTLMTADPTHKIKPHVPQRRPASYSVEQLHKLLLVCDARDRALLIVLLDTGLRAGELVSMDTSSIDWTSGEFRVIGKGNKERAGWLGPVARDELRRYLMTRGSANPALWVGPKGRLTVSGLYQVMRRRAEQAGIRQDVRRLIHSTRASFAKHYIQQGGDLESLRKLLGHQSIIMSSHYAQLADDELADRKNRVNPLGMVLVQPPRNQSSRMATDAPADVVPGPCPNTAASRPHEGGEE